MNDFSTAAIIRLIALGLKRQGIAMPHEVSTSGPYVDLKNKRALLSALLERHGAQCLLRIGEALLEAPSEPILVAMRMAREPHDLLDRWQRLERYVHSRHRTIVLRATPGQLALRHVSGKKNAPPLPGENLLVVGVLTGFFDLIGAADLSVQIGSSPGISRKNGQWAGDYHSADTADWIFSWENEVCPIGREPMDGHNEDWLATVRAFLATDPGRRWTVDLLAGTIGVSPRSLQRRFQTEGTSFSEALRSARLARSAELLTKSASSPAEIGYTCGYSDQAHFSREFKRYSTLTPGVYRETFA